jgi:serine/threonine protein kinase
MKKDNIAETILESSLSCMETVLDSNNKSDTSVEIEVDDRTSFFKPGQTIAGKYVVHELLNNSGSQASVYVVQNEGIKCIVKLYYRGFKPVDEFVRTLKNHDCPYIAKLLDFGYEDDRYFEIYEYYSNGTLEEKGKCSHAFIRDIVIPNINEGLNFLHTLGNYGIVHGDIKPSNIFISSDENRVVIGDFGISAYMNKKGRLVSDIKGTPEYAPRSNAFFGVATKTPAYDFGSFGLMLIKIVTGRSLFEGLDIYDITQLWESGLKIPESIDGRLRRLISGLLVEDERQRFNYTDVKKWCEGEYLNIKENSLYTKEDFEIISDPDPLVFGILDDRILTVSTLNELAIAIENNWEHTKKLMKKPAFIDFINQFDPKIAKNVGEYCRDMDQDIAVFKILYSIRINPKIVYKGINYGSLKDFARRLDFAITDSQHEIIDNGLLEFFLKKNNFDEEFIESYYEISKLRCNDPEFVPFVLRYLFSESKVYEIQENKVTSIDQLIDTVIKMDVSELVQIVNDSHFLAWLYSIGFKENTLGFFDV